MAFSLLFVAIGAAFVKWPRGRVDRYFGWAFLTFAALWTATATVAIGAECRRCVRGGAAETTHVVEGPVRDFVPMPYTGHSLERFTVNGVRFSYSDFVITCGFNNTASHGGPIGAGRLVRIHHDDNLILKLEVAR